MPPSKKETLLSVVVPVSNLSGQLSNLRSWLIQESETDLFQIILVHDIQDNETSIELRDICEHNEGIIFLEGYFGSPGEARNRGMELATSDWICFWDADDLPNILTIRDSLIKHNQSYDVIVGHFEVRDYETNLLITGIELDGKLSNDVQLARSPGLWRYLFHKSVLKQIRFPSLRMGEDQVFLSAINPLSHRMFFDTSLFYTYFVNRTGQLTGFRPALFDLQKVQIHLAYNYRATPKHERNNFQIILLARVLLTGVYKRNLRLIILSTLQLPTLFWILGLKGILKLVQSISREIYFYFENHLKKESSST